MTTYSVLQGRTITLPVEWLDYPGGPAAPVTAVTIEVKPAAGGASTIGPTATGVTHVATGLDTYQWTVPTAQAIGDYAVIWRGTDAQGDQVSATDIVTVAAQSPPIAGSYATVADLANAMTPKAAPANAAQLLVRASRDVNKALLCQVYDATDPNVVTALREATLEQVAGNLGVGNVTGLGAQAGGFTIGKLSVQPKAGGGEGAPRRIGPLWEQAWDVLQQAQLTGQGPWGY